MPLCSFDGCLSGSRKRGTSKDPSIILHRFPKDEELRCLWTQQIQNESKYKVINYDSGFVLKFSYSFH